MFCSSLTLLFLSVLSKDVHWGLLLIADGGILSVNAEEGVTFVIAVVHVDIFSYFISFLVIVLK